MHQSILNCDCVAVSIYSMFLWRTIKVYIVIKYLVYLVKETVVVLFSFLAYWPLVGEGKGADAATESFILSP